MSATILAGPRVDGRPRARLRDDPDSSPRAVVLLAIVVAVPFIVAAVRAATGGWVALGDDANVLIRARDVLTSNTPLVGAWSSASIAIGEHVNQPGPLLFDLLWLPARMAGDGGLASGMALVNAICAVVAVVFGARAAGTRGAVAVAAAASALAWTMGSSLLYDPWQPHAVIFPFLLVLVLVWAMVVGDVAALPVAAGVASLVVQTHGSFVFITPTLCAIGAVALVARHRRALLPPAIAAAVVLAVCWAQPVVDQVTGTGNLAALARGLGDAGTEEVGPSRAVRLTADVLAIPPFFARESFDDGIGYPPGQPRFVDGEPNVAGLPSLTAAAVSLVALAGALALATVLARRRREHALGLGLGVCAAAVLLSLLSTAAQPIGAAGLSAHLQRYLWPVAVMTAALVVSALLPRRWSLALPAAAAVALAVATLPAHAVQASGPAADEPLAPVVRDLRAQLADRELPSPLVVNTKTRYAEPWTSALMAALQGIGVDWRVDDEGWARQIGTGRRDDGRAQWVLFFREGESADTVPPRARRIAIHDGLSMDERAELGRRERDLDSLTVVLDDAGRAAVAVDGLPAYAHGRRPTTSDLLVDGTLAEMLRLGLVVVPRDRAAELARYEHLRIAADRETVAVYLAPRG
ncbi:MAG: hypothetical protein QOD30_150 [Actinomycetota bacterium]|nr:hypothetical protein [Actinomycetota bacterium]